MTASAAWFLLIFLIGQAHSEKQLGIDALAAGFPERFDTADECEKAAHNVEVVKRAYPEKFDQNTPIAMICVPGFQVHKEAGQ